MKVGGGRRLWERRMKGENQEYVREGMEERERKEEG